ncbi:hypothetical protein SAMN05216215_103359 [Saccharopolyspora shandongensis]|uniref:Uncharacterized protein n=1 Tax=Saccharopolyspora shandongensis TaxID=418495 RepID=A0A1H3M675_9PSEU|nr:hypothetical protein [Saccharopolyspora shandongensis]SDY71768.1 hypothetical protein SAMN05216215_103359 [Saccharopolyspora shandongensis]
MKPVVHVELTGAAIKTVLILLLLTIGVLALVWLLAGPGYAIAGGIAVIVIVRGLYALFTPSSE